MHVPSKKLEEKVDNCNTVTVEMRKSPSENSRASLRKQERTQKEEEAALTGKNAVGKIQQKAQYAIYRETAPRYTKRSAMLSLKRHAAWEYTETTTQHQCFSLSLHPRSPRGPMSAKSSHSFKNQLFFNPPIFAQAK